MEKERGKRLQRVAPHLSREQKTSLEVADPEGVQKPATSRGISYVT